MQGDREKSIDRRGIGLHHQAGRSGQADDADRHVAGSMPGCQRPARRERWRSQTDPASFAQPERGPGDEILLVDDHRESLAALQAVLEPLGERTGAAPSPASRRCAALLHKECRGDPARRAHGRDGRPADGPLSSARAPGTRHIPIIFMTAQSSELDQITRAYESGAVDYVVKPFDPEILRAKVACSCSFSRERAERVRESRARAAGGGDRRHAAAAPSARPASRGARDVDGRALPARASVSRRSVEIGMTRSSCRTAASVW